MISLCKEFTGFISGNKPGICLPNSFDKEQMWHMVSFGVEKPGLNSQFPSPSLAAESRLKIPVCPFIHLQLLVRTDWFLSFPCLLTRN